MRGETLQAIYRHARNVGAAQILSEINRYELSFILELAEQSKLTFILRDGIIAGVEWKEETHA